MRENGYYWIRYRYCEDTEIAYWGGREGWIVIGYDGGPPDEEVEVLSGPLVAEPQ